MSKLGAQMLETLLALPAEERAELADRLISSLNTDRQHRLDELCAAEAEDRIDAFERGEMKAVSAQEVFDAIKGARR